MPRGGSNPTRGEPRRILSRLTHQPKPLSLLQLQKLTRTSTFWPQQQQTPHPLLGSTRLIAVASATEDQDFALQRATSFKTEQVDRYIERRVSEGAARQPQ